MFDHLQHGEAIFAIIRQKNKLSGTVCFWVPVILQCVAAQSTTYYCPAGLYFCQSVRAQILMTLILFLTPSSLHIHTHKLTPGCCWQQGEGFVSEKNRRLTCCTAMAAGDALTHRTWVSLMEPPFLNSSPTGRG